MRSEIPIPLWLKQKSADSPSRTEAKSGKVMPTIVIGTLISYFGLMALEMAKPDTTVRAKEVPQLPMNRKPSETNPPTEKQSVPLRRLADGDLASMEPLLMEIHRHINADKTAVACEVTAKQKFNLNRMTLPSRYGETLCYAETCRDLSFKLNNPHYLELAAYYYRRCLYLIDGQLQGQFKKPKGGDDEIRERQKAVYTALDSIEQSERF